MQQIIFKREFFFPFDVVKTENAQYLEKKIQPIKRIVIENIARKYNVARKKSLKI